MRNPQIEISWQAGAPPPELEEAALREALTGFLAALGHGQSGLSLLLAGDEQLRSLNQRHRGIDKSTDILSWSYRQDEPSTDMLGELAVSLERARAQALENGWDLRTELLRLLAHGCAHLAGYDHATDREEREMRAVEIAMLEGAGLRGLYPR
ncbi:MAG: rRNA maturation RNase YbeY [SAR324 cluster bacterium]|nr:rRNA maturation RNase YbeY [SAR324 cluster bacterium]